MFYNSNRLMNVDSDNRQEQVETTIETNVSGNFSLENLLRLANFDFIYIFFSTRFQFSWGHF